MAALGVLCGGHDPPRYYAESLQPGAGRAAHSVAGSALSILVCIRSGHSAPSFLANFTGALGPAQPAGTTPQPAATAPQPAQPGSPGYIPSLESVFGTENCWEAAPTGIGPNGTYSYNPIYFATQQTAQVVAK